MSIDHLVAMDDQDLLTMSIVETVKTLRRVLVLFAHRLFFVVLQ